MKTEIKREPNHTIGDFFSKSLWHWFYHYFKSRFGKKADYKTYTSAETGLYDMAENGGISIAVTSDWSIMKCMQEARLSLNRFCHRWE